MLLIDLVTRSCAVRLGFENAGKAFEVLIQFGAILALLSVYAGRLWHLLTDLPSDPKTRRFALGVIIAFLPAAIVGVLFHDFITRVMFESVTLISIMLILGGIAMLIRAIYFFRNPTSGRPPLRIVVLEEPPMPGKLPDGASIVTQT